MSMPYDLEKLAAMPAHHRAELYKNASRLAHTREGAALKRLIEEAGLPFSDSKPLSMDEPVTAKMWDVINSEQGKRLAVEATERGLPALALIDPLLQAALGVDYGAHNQATNRAGILVGDLMISKGYKHAGVKKLPPGCVAKTAATWR